MAKNHRKTSLKVVADHFSVTKATIGNWIRAGCPHDRPGGTPKSPPKFDLDEVSVWVKKTGRRVRHGGDSRSLAKRLNLDPGSEGESLTIEQAKAKLRKDLAAAEKAEMELERLRGELLDAEEVKQGQLDRIARARAVLLGGPASLAPDLEGLAQDEIEERLRDWVHQSLMELASDE